MKLKNLQTTLFSRFNKQKSSALMLGLFTLLSLSSCYVEVYDDPAFDCTPQYALEYDLLQELDYINYQYDNGLISREQYDYEFGFVEGQLYQLELDFPMCFY